MFLVEPQQRRASILEYLTKGKGKVAEEGLVGAKRGRPKMVHRVPRPNANFADPLPDEDSTDEVERITTVPPAKCQYDEAKVKDGVTVMKCFGIGQMWGDQFDACNSSIREYIDRS
ncbi:hypothetical protein YC2023_050275 [Brassica napus]